MALALIDWLLPTMLTATPLLLVVAILLVPYVYKILFLRARVDTRSYQRTRSQTAPVVRRLRKLLDFDARHWRYYVADKRRNLEFRIAVSFLFDVAKAAGAYYRSGE